MIQRKKSAYFGELITEKRREINNIAMKLNRYVIIKEDILKLRDSAEQARVRFFVEHYSSELMALTNFYGDINT